MYRQEVRDFEGWRVVVRPMLAGAVAPDQVVWSDRRERGLTDCSGLSGPNTSPTTGPAAGANRPPSIPRRLMSLLEDLACYRDPNRWELMYRLTWRVLNQNRDLLDNDADPDVQLARTWEKSIR